MANPRNLFDLTGKTALVTGGSRGLGLQMAEVLGDFGANVVISARNEAELAEATGHLRARGAEASHLVADAADEEGTMRLADEAIERLGRIDILVNNAGTTWRAPTEDHPLDAFDRVMNVNLRSLLVLSQRVAKRSMIPNGYGRIVSVASIFGMRGRADLIGYTTSKGAVISLTRGLAASWGQYGITANALAPGMFPSRMTQGMLESQGEEAFANAAPLRRIGDDQDLKGALMLFSSDAGKHITGQTLAVDGGITAV